MGDVSDLDVSSTTILINFDQAFGDGWRLNTKNEHVLSTKKFAIDWGRELREQPRVTGGTPLGQGYGHGSVEQKQTSTTYCESPPSWLAPPPLLLLLHTLEQEWGAEEGTANRLAPDNSADVFRVEVRPRLLLRIQGNGRSEGRRMQARGVRERNRVAGDRERSRSPAIDESANGSLEKNDGEA